VVGGEQVTVPGQVKRITRDQSGLHLAIQFFNGDAVNLGWLINQAQREDIRAAQDVGEPTSEGALEHPRSA
jgi:hypothetical protein